MEQPHGSLRSYVIGFVLSIVFTLIAYLVVVEHVYSLNPLATGWVVLVLAVLAIAQLYVQLSFFLHLGRGTGARWNVLAFSFMVLVVFIVGGGSLWIMNNLNYHMTGPDQGQYLIKDEGIKR